jgi:hypothetical protein
MTTEHQLKHEKVQDQINEILRQEHERKKLKTEIEGVLQGYAHYLEREGFGGIEIPMILNQLSFSRYLTN